MSTDMSLWFAKLKKRSELQRFSLHNANNTALDLFVKRDDLIDPFISGNKLRKLEGNLMAAKDAGASTAVWNKTTKMLKITYLASATSGVKVQEKIASVGYDTKDLTAPDAVYNELPECCQYERKAAKKN